MTGRRFIPTKSQPLSGKTFYNLHDALDLVSAVEQQSDSSSPYLRNVRYKSKESIKTRKGAGHYTTPVGQAQDTSQASTTGASSLSPSLTLKVGQKFTAGTTGHLTRLDLNVKNTGGNTGTGVLMVEVWSDASGTPGTKLTTSSVLGGTITSSLAYQTANFLFPASVTSGTAYWVVSYIQDDGSGSYALSTTTSGTNAKTQSGGGSWTSASVDINYKTYVSTTNPVLNSIRFYQSTGTKMTVFATKAGVFTVNDATGAVSQIFSGTTTATQYSFEQTQDTLYWVNGVDAPQQYNGSSVSQVPGIVAHLTGRGITTQPFFVKLHKNLLVFLLTDQIVFSNVGDPTTYPSTNFIYIPAPKTADPCVALVQLQDSLFIRTRGTRWQLSGADISTFVLRRSTGLQGVVGSLATVTHENFEYSVSDNGVYVFNGATEKLLSAIVQPELDAVLNKPGISLVVSGNYLRLFYPTPGSAYNNQALIFDLIYQNWFIDDAAYFSGGCVERGNGDAETLVLNSSITGALYYADQDYNDVGAPIAMTYYTKYDSFGNPDAQKKNRRFYPEFVAQTGSYSVNIQVDYDQANTPQLVTNLPQQSGGAIWGVGVWGTFVWGALGSIRTRVNVPGGLFYRRQYRFSRTGVNNPVELLGWEDYYLLKRPK